MKMSNKQIGILLLGIIISFTSIILLGYLFYGEYVFINTMTPSQIFMNAVSCSIFYYFLKYTNLNTASIALFISFVFLALFFSVVRTVNNGIRDITFHIALVTSIYIYYRFISGKLNFIYRPIVLAFIFAFAEDILFMKLQLSILFLFRGISLPFNMPIEFEFGLISGFGLGVSIEIVNFITSKLPETKEEKGIDVAEVV
jgi:hypothetical protein